MKLTRKYNKWKTVWDINGLHENVKNQEKHVLKAKYPFTFV